MPWEDLCRITLKKSIMASSPRLAHRFTHTHTHYSKCLTPTAPPNLARAITIRNSQNIGDTLQRVLEFIPWSHVNRSDPALGYLPQREKFSTRRVKKESETLQWSIWMQNVSKSIVKMQKNTLVELSDHHPTMQSTTYYATIPRNYLPSQARIEK